MKHVRTITRAPQTAQSGDISWTAVFTLIADVLAAVGQAVLAKENQEFPTIPTPES